MSRAGRILFCIVMVVAVVAAVIWLLLFYRDGESIRRVKPFAPVTRPTSSPLARVVWPLSHGDASSPAQENSRGRGGGGGSGAGGSESVEFRPSPSHLMMGFTTMNFPTKRTTTTTTTTTTTPKPTTTTSTTTTTTSTTTTTTTTTTTPSTTTSTTTTLPPPPSLEPKLPIEVLSRSLIDSDDNVTHDEAFNSTQYDNSSLSSLIANFNNVTDSAFTLSNDTVISDQHNDTKHDNTHDTTQRPIRRYSFHIVNSTVPQAVTGTCGGIVSPKVCGHKCLQLGCVEGVCSEDFCGCSECEEEPLLSDS